jgi:hypothetical protein
MPFKHNEEFARVSTELRWLAEGDSDVELHSSMSPFFVRQDLLPSSLGYAYECPEGVDVGGPSLEGSVGELMSSAVERARRECDDDGVWEGESESMDGVIGIIVARSGSAVSSSSMFCVGAFLTSVGLHGVPLAV